ncbi:putative dehydrogenase [Melghirimyces profundicolus]|uniref:Putative dehydrogenase n=1 Tax=Melghirimyces profundicolus TaxID=1242148 RepID=A0A2T6AZA0_9BACL|nr:Gfo/Idh/MocA family oxidoreductase [Melghirimyces profundicolus]PTX49147.1 putative dehydrogenase [Melghirimyces profundicolus]
MKKIRVGVIGCGSIALHRHIPEYAAHPGVELIAFCDIHEGRAQAAAKRHGGQAFTDYREMIHQTKLDAVSVCTPNADHAAASIEAMNAGLHVLCEKPMAVSREEGEAMIRASRENGVKLMIGHNQRLMPPHRKAKEILQEGSLGRVLTFRTAFGHGGPEGWSVEGPGGWFFRKEQAFVGAMGDLGVHKADLLRWLLDDEIDEVGAFIGTLEKEETDVEDNAVLMLRTRKGAVGTLAASWTHHPGEDNSTVLYCEHGQIRIAEDPVDQVVVRRTDGTVEKYEVGGIATNEEGGQTVSGVIDAFVDSILEDTEPLIPGEEGLKSLQVILSALESAEKKTVVRVPE